MHFTKLDDSPMFRKQLQTLEESAEALRERCTRFHKGCRKYTEGLDESYTGDISFANAVETFGGGHDDPISVAVGGPYPALASCRSWIILQYYFYRLSMSSFVQLIIELFVTVFTAD